MAQALDWLRNTTNLNAGAEHGHAAAGPYRQGK